jgi:hypothetical protein
VLIIPGNELFVLPTKCAIAATAHAAAGNYSKADETAKESLELLKERLVVC